MPHPLEHKFVLKVQTEKPLTPPQALERTVDHLISDLSILEQQVKVQIWTGLLMNQCFNFV